jgi:hypothetical protein
VPVHTFTSKTWTARATFQLNRPTGDEDGDEDEDEDEDGIRGRIPIRDTP